MATAHRRPVLSPPQGPYPATLPRLQPDLDFNDTTLFAVYCFIKNFVGDFVKEMADKATFFDRVISEMQRHRRNLMTANLDYGAANNTSAVIDTKIEQAMDLVKSHLMYTVREEVEVLKERISELLDRINQLEMENSFLKANASPEVLHALNTRLPHGDAQGNKPSTIGADGGAASK